MDFDQVFGWLMNRWCEELPRFLDRDLGQRMRRLVYGELKEIEIKSLKQHCYKSYWLVCKCDDLPPALRLLIFECALEYGPQEAVAVLQRFLNVEDDGQMGELTLRALEGGKAKHRLSCYLNYRLFLRGASVDIEPDSFKSVS